MSLSTNKPILRSESAAPSLEQKDMKLATSAVWDVALLQIRERLWSRKSNHCPPGFGLVGALHPSIALTMNESTN